MISRDEVRAALQRGEIVPTTYVKGDPGFILGADPRSLDERADEAFSRQVLRPWWRTA